MSVEPVLPLRFRGVSVRVPVLFEDREVMVVDKPAGWMLAPPDWNSTRRNLWAALEEGVAQGAWWARARGLRMLRPVHRLDAETTGVLLLAKQVSALSHYSKLFATGRMEKTYLAVVAERPSRESWTVRVALADRLDREGRIRVDERHGREAETAFRLVERRGGRSLIEARPRTGRTHQIRVHLAMEGYPILGDVLYGGAPSPASAWPLALRAVRLSGGGLEAWAEDGPFLRAFGLVPVAEDD
jgi:RluA family pseudouridine synthase